MIRQNIFYISIILFSVLIFGPTSFSQETNELGIVTAVKGDVTVTNSSGIEEVNEGSVVLLGDIFETGDDSGVKILLDDDSLLSLGDNTKYEFNEFIYTPETRESLSNITKGQIRAIIRKVKGDNADIKFITPTASAGIKGTTLFIDADENIFAVKEGIVAVEAKKGSANEVLIKANQYTKIVNGEPIKPRHMSNELWHNYLMKTEIPQSFSSNTGSISSINLTTPAVARLPINETDMINSVPSVPPINLTSPLANVAPVTIIIN